MSAVTTAAGTGLSPDDRAGLSAILEQLTRQHVPEGAVERHWVRQMAMAMLRQTWADALEGRVVEAALAGRAPPTLPSPSLLPRWRARLEKDFRQAASELAASQAQRREAARTDAPVRVEKRHTAQLAEFERDPQTALARLMAEEAPFDASGTYEPEPPARPLNRAQRRRLEARQRHRHAA